MHRAKRTDEQLSLRGKITIDDMGTRVEKQKPFTVPSKRSRKETNALDQIYAFVQSYLQDISPQVLESACSMLISIIKDHSVNEDAQKTQVESILGFVDGEQFNRLVSLTMNIKEENQYSGSESELDSDSDVQNSTESSASEDESEEEEEMSVPGWCENPHYLKVLLKPTPVKPTQVLPILEDEECEQDLVKLFNFEFLDIVEQLMQNRLQIYWYTKYLNAETGLEREKAFETIKKHNLEPSKKKTQMETIDLDALVPSINSRFTASPDLKLPEGTEKSILGSYEQYKVPFEQSPQNDQPLVAVSSMPEWAQPAFEGLSNLNRVQSKVYDATFESSGNLLLCAPTGAGKTNAALLTMLRCFHQHKDFKIVYISPLKALVQEQVRTFSAKLKPLNLRVGELTGDSNMTSDEIAATHVIITTPEKWDIVTRKTFDVAYTALVKLVIIDEIHLLHDPRGPAIENIVARSLQLSPETRLVGLSATLPNYENVAKFLRAEFCFYFDSSFRPCPLQQTFCGITEKSVFKRHKALNEICLEKVLEFFNDYQSIVFVHSRKDTVNTAKYIIENSAVFPTQSIDGAEDQVLSGLINRGVGIHHAGLSRADRSLVEGLFLEGKLKVLVSTATLAWGVNLPAHAVIIKGTQVYSPQDGQWEELSPQDILQMLGRAGRPGFDTFGEGIVITLHDQLAYYMSILISQFPIESQLITRLTDSLNAEVSLGTVRTLQDGIDWLGRTYYFIRMKSEPTQYRAGIDYDDGGEYTHRRKVIIHSALKYLHKAGLVKYDGNTIQPTKVGKIASAFYISPSSMGMYMKQLKPYLGPIDILRVFSRSKEFENIPLRQEEKVEVQKLGNIVPIPIKDKIDEPTAKISILLQAYIGRLKLVGMALSADMVYITQSASRLFRAMFELAVTQGWSALALELHQLCLVVDRKMWHTSSPFKQFSSCPSEVVRKTENSPMPWQRYLELEDVEQVASAIRSEKYAHEVFSLLSKFPKMSLNVMHQPLTPSLLRLNIEVTPQFRWDRQLHYRSQKFLLLVYDGDCERILHHEWLLVTEKDRGAITIQVTVPILDPITPAYFVACISDSWLHSTTKKAVNLENFIVPGKFAAPTPVRYMDPVDISHIDFPFTFDGPLSLMASQAFESLYATDANAFIGMAEPTLPLAELVLARHFSEPGLIAYIHPDEEQAQDVYSKWKSIENVGILAGDLSQDLECLASNKVIVSSVQNMDKLSRKWQTYEPIQAFNVIIVDGTHLIGGQDGYQLERTIVRFKFMATQLELPVRFVGLSYPVAGQELGKWIGATKQDILNFLPKDVANAPKLHVQSFDQRDYDSRQKMMIKTTQELDPDIIFVPSRELCIELAGSLHSTESYSIKTQDKAVSDAAALGLPFIYHGMHFKDLHLVLELQAKTIIATPNMARHLPKSETAIVLNTQYYDFQEGSYIDYTSTEVLPMIQTAKRDAFVLTTAGKTVYYDQFLRDPLPIESHLMYYLADTMMVELAEQVVDTPEVALDWLTYSYFFHRLRQNPSYYGLEEVDEDSINEYLSELVETTMEELSGENVVEIGEDDEMTLTPLDGAFIGSVYGLPLTTISLLNTVQPSSTLRDIFLLVSKADYSVTVDRKEYAQILKLASNLPFPPNQTPSINKVQVLLQLHLSRAVPPQWESDLKIILNQAISCVRACVDILSGKGALNTLVALDLQQMLTQGLWDRESPLKQIPYVDSDTITRCKSKNIATISDFLSIEQDDVRNYILGFDESDPRMVSVAQFCNDFPAIDIENVSITGDLANVAIIRDVDEDEQPDFMVHARYPYLSTTEQWYLIIGSLETRELYGAKKISITEPEQVFEVPLTIETAEELNLSVWCVCAGYLDADKESQVGCT